jgi:catechol 2,3-dioxygenase-like lactoylglutathione lyase family enzyme
MPSGVERTVVDRRASCSTAGNAMLRAPTDLAARPDVAYTAVMATSQPVCDQINLIVDDMDATVAFYRRLGLTIADAPAWLPGSNARHVEVEMPSGLRLEFDNREMAAIWHGSSSGDGRGRAVLGFSLPSRDAVDERYAQLTAAGYTGRRAPCDAFWGARFAIVQDPDGNDVGLMSPADPARRFVPGT